MMDSNQSNNNNNNPGPVSQQHQPPPPHSQNDVVQQQQQQHDHTIDDNDDIFTRIQYTILDGIVMITKFIHPISIINYVHVQYYKNDPIRTGGVLLGGGIVLFSPYGQSIMVYTIQFVLSIFGRIVGTTIGVALGLGFATHICNLLDTWEVRQQQQQQQQHMIMMMMHQGGTINDEFDMMSKEQQQQRLLLRRTNSIMIGPRRSRTLSSSGSVRTTSMLLPSVVSSPPPPPSSFSSSVSHYQLPSPPSVVVLPTIHSQHDFTASISSSSTIIANVINSNSILEDGQTYQSLMSSAGYHKPMFRNTTSTGMLLSSLRGQVIRHDQIPTQINYLFTSKQQLDVTQWTAVIAMKELWTDQIIPPPVQIALGKSIEYIVRDFIALWYSKADVGCIYNPDETDLNDGARLKRPTMNFTRAMLYSVAVHRPLPFVDAIYQSCAIIFGNLATRVEQNVNVMELLLVKYTKILAHTFKWYRHLRKQVKFKQQLLIQTARGTAQQQQSSMVVDRTSTTIPSTSSSIKNSLSRRKGSQSMRRNSGIRHVNDDTIVGNDEYNNNNSTKSRTAAYVPVSEIAMTKEFLVNGKLHKAVTFGLDVPSLLYSDTNGRGCGIPYKEQQTVVIGGATTTKNVIRVMDRDDEASAIMIDDDVLAARLYNTNILAECELDYNRVVGHRMVKALIPRSDFGSAIVQTVLTEIMAGCVLSPIMSLFSPDTISSWIVMGLSPSEAASSNVKGDARASEKELDQAGTLSECAPPGSSIEIVTDELNGNHEFLHQEQCTDNSIELTKTEDEDIRSRVHPPMQSISNDLQDLIPPKIIDQVTGATSVEATTSDVLTIITEDESAATNGASLLTTGPSQGGMTSLLTMALIDLQQFMDFDDCRHSVDDAPNSFYQNNVDWEGDACRDAIVRLVLVIEAALLHGRCTYKIKDDGTNDNVELHDELYNEDSDLPVEVTLPEFESISLTQTLMEMTGDIDAFEQRVAAENILMREKIAEQYDHRIPLENQPSATEISSLRTLIAAWLENGQIYRTVTLLVQAHATILAPFYHKSAFLRSKDNANGFVRQLRSLENVMILVDTIAVLSSPRLNESNATSLFDLTPRSKAGVYPPRNSDETQVEDPMSPAARIASQLKHTTSVPRYLDFHRNESLAASLCSERERRMQSWDRMVKEEMEGGLHVVCRSRGTSKEDVTLHKELHHIAMLFYYETVVLSIRDAARRTSFEPENSSSSVVSSLDSDRVTPFSLLTIEAACPKRRLEIPDDDSSFLLRGQPRVLNAVGVHRDPRNHDHSYKSFAASIEDVAKNEYYNGGRYIRRCLIRYYPSDRTAAADLLDDARKLDQRKCSIPDTITFGNATNPTTPLLSDDFMNNRYLCQRWVPKGTTRSQSLLASGTMEGSDFTLIPRAGKAIEFVYRMSYYERPMVDLSGKHFTVFDSTALGVHRADASALELSDASLSIALEVMAADTTSVRGQRQHVELGKDGYPVVWLKSSRKQDDVHVEAKSYRLSFVRAALLITSARHEAQLKCVISCIKAGSPSKATKVLAESYLKPTLRLIEHAGSRSRKKQSVLLRDLKLGVNHIDIDQLRRNALLSPRYPTELLNLSAIVDDVVESADTKSVDIFGVSNTLFKLKCSATVTIVAPEEEMIDNENYRTESGLFAEKYKEEWVVYRSLKEFQALHKHLKLQVSATESSGTAGSRLVGAATAAFAATTASIGRTRQRKMLIPSLSQASKAGALGVTKKIIFKRKEILDGYLSYILSPGHLLGRCSELLLFLGASFPLDPNVRVSQSIFTPSNDLLGRTEMTRSVMQLRCEPLPNLDQANPTSLTQPAISSVMSVDSQDDEILEEDMDGDVTRKNDSKDEMNNIAVRNKIDKVRLPLVRTRIFELLRYQFGFENASFARNRLLAALKTASFAVTSASDFRKTLYKLHVEHLNSDAIAGLINMLTDILWPNGTFFESSPPQSPDEIQIQANKAKELLHGSFPDQVRAILGSELTKDGLDIFHEMLQNRIVVKSMAYMLFDHLWLEVFPEIGDVLSCGAAIDFDTKDV